jgi:hypothetical protein
LQFQAGKKAAAAEEQGSGKTKRVVFVLDLRPHCEKLMKSRGGAGFTYLTNSALSFYIVGDSKLNFDFYPPGILGIRVRGGKKRNLVAIAAKRKREAALYLVLSPILPSVIGAPLALVQRVL